MLQARPRRDADRRGKTEAHYTYKGEKAIAELGLVVGHEFRQGDTVPAARNLEFMQACERNMPRARRSRGAR